MYNTDTPGGIALKSSPGLIYAMLAYIFQQPIEKWVSAITLIFVTLQMIFFLFDRMKKRRIKRHMAKRKAA